MPPIFSWPFALALLGVARFGDDVRHAVGSKWGGKLGGRRDQQQLLRGCLPSSPFKREHKKVIYEVTGRRDMAPPRYLWGKITRVIFFFSSTLVRS